VLGRLTSDAVTALGSGVNGAVQRIEYAYDSQGNEYLTASHNAATGGSIVNQVEDTFNGLGQLTNEYQSVSGAVNTNTTPDVQYAYTEMSGGQNNSRLTSMTYPNGYQLNFNYNTGLDSNISRSSYISDTTGTLEAYKYLGLDTVVEMDHPQTGINLTYIKQTGDPYANTDGGDQYTGLDRFGRIIDQFWTNGTTVDRYQYGYNQDSDVLYRQNLVDTAMSELYTYDNVNQLSTFARGTLNSTKTGITGTPSATQSWSPDALGNFNNVTTNGTQQTRTANQQNEITSISGQSNPAYDANGNMTADGTGNTYVYDAWNRLVAVKNGSNTLASYSYDGLNRQISITESGTTDLYYSSADQVLAEYQGTICTAYTVYSPVYVNAIVFRNVSANGQQYTRYYALQDADWNVTAWVYANGTLVERYAYSPYGAVTAMSPSWVVQSSTLDMPVGYQGMRYDWTLAVNYADNRVYDPALERWLQADPLGLEPDNNDYRMVEDDPTDAVDATGLLALGLRANPQNRAIAFNDFVFGSMWNSADILAFQTMFEAQQAEANRTPPWWKNLPNAPWDNWLDENVYTPLAAQSMDSNGNYVGVGHRHTVWTAALLQHYLRTVYGVVVCRRSIGLAIARLEIRWKRPRHVLGQRPDTWRQAKGG
jgi:RHS repeat-associated protein